MAVAWASHNTIGWALGASAVITKPTGLAVGDLLLAIINIRTGGSAETINLPTNWVSLYDINTGTNTARMRAMYKVADSADVAASNFTFTLSGTVDYSGSLARVTGYGNINTFSTNTANNTTTSPLTTGTVTPNRADCLFILTAAGGQSGGGATPAFSGYTIVTDNPSWTEQFEIQDAVSRYSFAIATAIRTQQTATGTASISLSTPPTNGDYSIGMIAIAPQVSAVSTPDAIVNYNATFNLLSSVSNKMVVNEPTTTTTTPTNWQNEVKPTTDWDNETI